MNNANKIAIVFSVRCAVLVLTPATAIAASGQFTYVAGSVFIETNGRRVPAVRGS